MTGIAGAVTGGISCYRSNEIDVRMIPGPRHSGFSQTRSLEVGIVNSSQRAVSIVAGRVLFDGNVIGEVTRFTPGPASLDSSVEVERRAAASDLPYGLAGGQSFAGTVEWRLPDEGHSPDVIEWFEGYLRQERTGGQPADGRFRLELDHEPGAEIEKPVRLTFEFNPAIQPGHAPTWKSFLTLDRGDHSVTAFTTYTDLDPTLVSFNLWGRAPKPVFTATRPASRFDPTSIALPTNLPDGKYSWALTAGDKAVAVGRFATPCPDQETPAGRSLEVPSEMCKPPVGGGPRAPSTGTR